MQRFTNNPLVTPEMLRPVNAGFEIIGAFNAGATVFGDEVLMLLRVAERPIQDDREKVVYPILDCAGDTPKVITHQVSRTDPEADCSDPRIVKYRGNTYTTSISHFRLARSTDGYHFQVEPSPVLQPTEPYEELGIEDPRITVLDGTWYINYSAIATTGITTALIATQDWQSFRRLGPIFPPDNKDIAIFPAQVGGMYYAFHRPTTPFGGSLAIWLAQSPDLLCWGHHQVLLEPGPTGRWDDGRMGCGGPPLLTEQGWLEIFHAANSADRYCLGLVLLDKEHPERMLKRSVTPVLEPEASYESRGFFGQVVFSCGQVERDDKVLIYYGGADTVMAGVETSVDELLGMLE